LSGSPFLRYVSIGIAALMIVAGAVWLLDRGMSPPTSQNADTAKPANPTPPPAADDQAGPSAVQTDRLVSLIGEARRLAAGGKFDEAEASLQKADKVYSGWSETEKARAEIAQLRTPEGQLKTQLERARLAIEHNDPTAAEQALAEAERLNAQAPQIADLRAVLKDAEQKQQKRDSRVTELLTKMREEIARGDFAAADADLNSAERVNIQDPAVQQARRELARAREAKDKEQNK
jgi:tetratricopeptide (TPR) repeat protein